MHYCRQLTREEIASVYNTHMKKDFPRDELKPLSMVMSSLDKEQYFCYGIFDSDTLCGYAYFVSLLIDGKQICLLDYFAVVSGMRDSGIGSEFLHLLRNELTDAEMLICESEDPSAAADSEKLTRERRIAFYLRNGFVDTGASASVFGVDYVLLELDFGRRHSPEEIRAGYSALYSSFLPEKLYNRIVRV